MNILKQTINVDYPKGNRPIFEEWLSVNYLGCNTDRELIPVWFTSVWVNNGYGNDKRIKQEVQEFIDSLDRGKKFWCCTQYDDSVLIDLKDLDVLRFEMSKKTGVELPLLCQPHPFKFKGDKKWLASFVGSRTHPIRDSLDYLKNRDGYYISFGEHDIDSYCRILHESIFAICPRGYGINSFRCTEGLQYGAIPVYLSDEHIEPFGINFNSYGIKVHSQDAHRLHEIIEDIEPEEIIWRQDKCREVYEDIYTYQGCFSKIIKALEFEYYYRKQGGEIAEAV